MTFNNVLTSIRNNQAAKTPTMIGFFKREDQNSESTYLPVVEGEAYTAHPVDSENRYYIVVSSVTQESHFTFVENNDVDPYGESTETPDGITEYTNRRTSTTTKTVVVQIPAGSETTPENFKLIRNTNATDAVHIPEDTKETWTGFQYKAPPNSANAGTWTRADLVIDNQLFLAFASSEWAITTIDYAESVKDAKSTSRW